MKLFRKQNIKVFSTLMIVACVAISVFMSSCNKTQKEGEKDNNAKIDKKAVADVGFYETYLADEIAPNIKQLIEAIPSDDPNRTKLIESIRSDRGPAICQANKGDKTVVDAIFEKYGKDILPADLKLMWTLKPETGNDGKEYFYLVALKTNDSGNPAMNGESITDAEVAYEDYKGSFISLTMDRDGGKKFSWLTARNVGRPLAIVYRDKVISYPSVNSQVDGGRVEITGRFTLEEAQEFVDIFYGKKK